jgi:CelD/BcsL family acetyltransferase involved in cellulose biosynthesis
VAEIADKTIVDRASTEDATPAHAPAKSTSALAPLADIPVSQWHALADRVAEPNAYYLPEWALAVSASARGRIGASALSACSDAPLAYDGPARMIGLLPVISLWRACRIPLPALVSAQPYGTLCTPPLDCHLAEAAAERLLAEARKAGAHALVLRDMSLDGNAMRAFTEVLRLNGMRPRLMRSDLRACLDATRSADELLLDALGAKKLKELRRLRHRLAEHGAVRFEAARTPDEVARALEDATFIRRATAALAETEQCEIVTLRAGDVPVAAAIVLRHQDRAFYFKLGIDERFARYSPGVQLTLDLTRHLCSDPAIRSADSTAAPDHPMINPIWRGRFAIGDVLIPLRRRDPLVPMIHAALAVRRVAENAAREAVRLIRTRGKSRGMPSRQ